ncbi:hypothetical protein [Rosistilla oblonga]|uniref:hypothetical protein n=1 Tax=Rosistilla oblonga TaxID=2527990 RepID=UPI0018D2372F|nr:hypothetical protein [Rosistilla oblonga]
MTRIDVRADRIVSLVDLHWTHPSAVVWYSTSLPIMTVLPVLLRSASDVVDPLLGAGKFACFNRFDDCSANWVEVDIGCTGQQACFIENQLRFIPTLPKVTVHVIFRVTASGNVLRRAPHPPTDIRQPTTALSKNLFVVDDRRDFCVRWLGRAPVIVATDGE